MRRAAYWTIVEKSRAACVAAVETYNRVASAYREETFAILMINAWELLLKARIMKENGGKVSSLYEYVPRETNAGKPSKRLMIKRSRSGAPITIGVVKAYNLVRGFATDNLDDACVQNLHALVEIRDCATHFIHSHPLLRKMLNQVAMASVKNYVIASQKWFKVTYADLNVASVPISFALDQTDVEAVAKQPPAVVARFLSYLAQAEASIGVPASEYAFTVRVEFDLVKKKTEGAAKVELVSEGAEITIGVDEDKIPQAFPWNYKTLCYRLTTRYSDFKQNKKYHNIRRSLEKNKKLCFERRLDPSNKKSQVTRFYNPNIITHFDPHYTLKGVGIPLPAAATA